MKSLDNVKCETFLRSLTKQIPTLKALAQHLNYNSDTFQLMLSLHDETLAMEENLNNDMLTEYENVSYISKCPKIINTLFRNLRQTNWKI